MSTITVNKSHATINVGSNASYIVNGDDDIITVGANSSVTANGYALSLQVTGAGSIVSIGGNGVAASNAHDNTVLFKGVAGTLHELANARTDVTGNSVTATMAGNDALGLYGTGDAVGASGTGNSIWIGQNGNGVFGAGMDYVLGLTHGSAYEMQGSSVATDGSYYNATLSAQDLLLASGVGVHVTVTAAGDTVYIGGNGSAASNTDEDVVLFQAAGTINVTANSRIDTTGSDVMAALAGTDTFGLYGSGDTITAGGTGDAIWFGQNGYTAAGAAIDAVHGLTSGSVYEMQGSDVAVDGTNYSVTMSGDDTLTASGTGVTVNFASGSLNTAMVNGAAVGANSATSDTVVGDNNSVALSRGAVVNVLGGGNVVSAAEGAKVTVGQIRTTGSSAATTVQWSSMLAGITVLGNSSASLSGNSAAISLQGGDRVSVTGSADLVSDTSGDNQITIGGNGSANSSQTMNQVTLSTADSVTMLANSSLTLHTSGAVTNGDYAVQMAANDYLALSGGETVYVPTAAGADFLAGFGSTDVLSLANHFASISDLVAHIGFNHLNQTTIQLDTSGDTLSFDISKATLTAYANAGLIKFT